MPALGEVLERLHTAWDHLNSARGTMRLRYDPERTHRAFEVWRQGGATDSVRALHAAMTDRETAPATPSGDGAPPNAREEVFRFWMVKPWHWRVEILAVEQEQVTHPREVMVINEAIWWTWTGGSDAHTNARDAQPEQREHSGVDRALLVMLDPAALVGTLRMSVDDSADALGRHGIVVSCSARNPQVDPGLWPGADQYRLLIDRRHGILLRAEALQAEDTYAETAFTDLALDEAIPDERFAFEVPPGVRVHYHR